MYATEAGEVILVHRPGAIMILFLYRIKKIVRNIIHFRLFLRLNAERELLQVILKRMAVEHNIVFLSLLGQWNGKG